MERRYIKLTEVASSRDIEPLDVLGYGIDGEIPIGVLAFCGVSPTPQSDSFMVCEDDKGDSVSGNTPDWLIMLMPKTLREIALVGIVHSGRGFRWHDDDWEVVEVNSETGITLNNLVVPRGAIQELGGSRQHVVTVADTPITKVGKETLLKQLAALAITLAKTNKYYSVQGKPNRTEIAESAHQVVAEMKKYFPEIDDSDQSHGSIRNHISEGLKLMRLSVSDSTK